MFEFEGFGQRLAKLRKSKNMTQGEFADRLGVTAQAVSKWENDLSYPDITLIPTIATIFDVEVNDLFGFKKTAVKENWKFPKFYEDLVLVHSFQNVGCYSSKEVASIDGSGVKFKDGSSAELSNRLILNMGKGEIRLLLLDEASPNLDYSQTSKNFDFDFVENYDIEVLNNGCEIVPSPDQKCHVHARGDGLFIGILEAFCENNKLIIRFKDKEDNNFNSKQQNQIKVELPCAVVKNANVRLNGSGELVSEIGKAETGRIAVNGSGTIKMLDFDTVSVAINGSGCMEAQNAEKAEMVINGSGSMTWQGIGELSAVINGSGEMEIDNLTVANINVNGSGDLTLAKINDGGEMTVKIAGSGDITIKEGYCKKLDFTISGSGDIDAKGVSTHKASIILKSNGEVTIGRVIDSSIEQIMKKGIINILQRGKNGD
ncbi:MAG TPA: DUF2807 domain-containing protein [Bacilli bacterium]|nr:DUF2807 domain-containing protein [Bacilli bacterium]